MIIRLRSRDGLERIEVADGSTLDGLKQAIKEKLGIPLEDMLLSKNPGLLTAKSDAAAEFRDMAAGSGASLASLGVSHGDVVYLLYHFERQVEGVKLSEFERRAFGAHMTVESMVAAQTRIERQEAPHCAAVSFDSHAANAFQSYVQSALAFSIKRGGILYGTVEEGGEVRVNAIYEPPQQGNADSLQLARGGAEEALADAVAAGLGWGKVGWIFTQSTKERDFIMSSEEICQMAAVQSEMGEHAVTALVALFPPEEEGGPPEVHFEAFQVSDQCVSLWEQNWFQPGPEGEGPPSGTSTLRNPKEPKNGAPVIVAGKDQGEVDNDYFLMPVGIKSHDGPVGTSFPVENRLLAQGKAELRAHLQKNSGKPYAERLADFHLLLYLARQPMIEEGELGVIVGAVAQGAPLSEGYTLIIDSLAGL